MISATYTWGISGPDFLWFYGGLSAAVAAVIGWSWWRALGRAGHDEIRDLDMFELAMLNGGPELTITTAATKLLRDGVLRRDIDGLLVVAGELGSDAHRVEREVFEVAGQANTIDASDLRDAMAESAAIRSLRARLVDDGLLLVQSRARQLHWIWLLGVGLAALGVARLASGALDGRPVGYLFGSICLVVLGTIWLSRREAIATARGRRILGVWRTQRDDLRRMPQAGHSALTVALFGSAALWLADPDIADALGIRREAADSSGGGGSGGGCSGGGGCGGGGCGGG